jgi:hypothetical protein
MGALEISIVDGNFGDFFVACRLHTMDVILIIQRRKVKARQDVTHSKRY